MAEIFDLLRDDHRTVESLFEQFAQTQDAELALQICEELTVHAMLEEELVYPVLATKVSNGLANEARNEHNEAKGVITQIEAGVGRGEDVSALVTQLQEAVQHHVQEEETEVLPQMEAAVPEFVGHMGEDYVERKKTLLAQVEEARANGMAPSTIGNKATNAG